MSSQPRFSLGSFDVQRSIGEGGMGKVFLALHRTQRVPVAIKVIHGEAASRPRYRDAFRREVQAVAALNHPGITTIFDYGLVGSESGAESEGIEQGSPWFAMELATRGTVDAMLPVGDWPTARWILLGILDALAHAHSRSIIHRDLKPQNVLLTDAPGGRVEIKLTDFGISLAVNVEQTARTADIGGATAGTPLYMAPEQFEGRWRDNGPWTDLYSLGCLAFQLLGGAPPFVGNLFEIAVKHLRDPIPELTPRFPAPAGIAAWVQRLMAKKPIERFQRAADAAWALANLDDFGASARAPERTPAQLERNEAVHETRDWEGAASHADTVPELAATTVFGEWFGNGTDTELNNGFPAIRSTESESSAAARQLRADVPPIPPQWRRRTDQQLSLTLAGAGLGLFGLREIPFVARHQPRNLIWEALRRVQQSGRCEAIAITGPAGCGKSRLVEWIGQRAHEVGGAITLRARHGPIAGPSFGLPRLIAGYLQCTGLEQPAIYRRIHNFLAERNPRRDLVEQDTAALTTLIAGEDSDSTTGPVVLFGSDRERYVAMRRLLGLLAGERPLFIWIDDAQWGADAIAFSRYLLENQRLDSFPAVLLLTVKDEALAERPAEQELLSNLLARDDVQQLSLPPLDHYEQRRLVQTMLHLEPQLAAEIADRAEGNPLYAVQILGDLVQRDHLRAGSTGFDLRSGSDVALPESIYSLWQTRVSDLCRANLAPDRALQALQLAAALGQQVDSIEWVEAANCAGFTLPPNLLDQMIARGLATRDDQGWSFVHGTLRESLVRSAASAGPWKALNRACAAMISSLYPQHRGQNKERLALFRLEAGELEQALEPLLIAARYHRQIGGYRRTLQLLDRYDGAIEQLQLPKTAKRRLESMPVRAGLFEVQGDMQGARRIVADFLPLTEAAGYHDLTAEGLWILGTCASSLGDESASLRDLQRGLELFESENNAPGVVRTLVGLGRVHRRAGRLNEARLPLDRALQQSSTDLLRITTLSELVLLHIAAYDFDVALTRCNELLSISERVGSRGGRITAYNSLGEIRRHTDELDRAEASYRDALSLLEAIGHIGRWAVHCNLGLVMLLRRDFEGAGAEFHAVVDALHEAHWLQSSAHCALLPVAAAAGDAQAFDNHYKKAMELLERSKQVDPDLATTAQLAGQLWEDLSDSDRAEQAYRLAERQWRSLNNSARQAVVQRRLTEIAKNRAGIE